MVKIVDCDIMDSGAGIIAHQVNCMGVMGSGVARQIRAAFPEVYNEYHAYCVEHKDTPAEMLGTVMLHGYCLSEDECTFLIANMFAQSDYGRDGKRYTNYIALRKCFKGIAEIAKILSVDVALPYKVGCGLGGGDWENVVYPMICEEFQDVDVTICRYNPAGGK